MGLLCTSDQPVAWTATYTTYNVHKRRIFMPSAAFELAMPAVEVLQTYALDRTVIRIGPKIVYCVQNIFSLDPNYIKNRMFI